MSSLIALEIEKGNIAFVKAYSSNDGQFLVSEIGSLPLPPEDLPEENLTANGETVETSTESIIPESTIDDESSEEDSLPFDLTIAPALVADGFLGVINHEFVSTHNISLPFGDRKKIEQVAPLQIQDVVPFDIDDYILDTIISSGQDNVYDICAALAPSFQIRSMLQSLRHLQINPKIISTKASAVSAWSTFFPEVISSNGHLLSFTEKSFFDCLYVNGQLQLMREVDFPKKTLDLKFVATQLLMTNAKYARDNKVTISDAYLLGHKDLAYQLSTMTKGRVISLDLSEYYKVSSDLNVNGDNYAWALGLMLHENIRGKKTALINFRRGPFAYKQFFTDIINAAKEQIDYYFYAVAAVAIWIFISIYTTSLALAKINETIDERMKQVLPNEFIDEGKEITLLSRKLETINDELKDLGPPTTITTLESILLLSSIITKEVDTKIETLSIGPAGILFQGSVSDLAKIGKLQSILENNRSRFCEVKEDSCKISVEPKGQLPGSNRTKFSAEIVTMDLKDKGLERNNNELE
ncbi:MAG: hypothetical protein IT292_10015 [Deltaproteobacteria bacterium]|nr:hypothetical protein [Deltaproteobacteria bacterium]